MFAGRAQQSGFYVPQKGKVYFAGDTATIFSNVINHGKLGVDKKAVVNFKGKKWENDPQALITDEGNKGEDASGTGGLVRFNGAGNGRQQIDGGYNAVTRSGPAFANVEIQNSQGVEVVGSTAKIRRNLQLTQGLLYLQDNTLVIGDGNPGNITGYDSVRYIITGGAGGLLVRENVSWTNSWVIFPIGSKENSYTPAAVRNNSGRGDDYHARVTDGVKSNLFSGNDMTAESVNKTWEIGKRFHPNQDVTDVVLQHLVADEGAVFNANRTASYISQFNAAGWDTVYPQTSPVAGYLTPAGAAWANSGANTRSFNGKIASTSYFSKFTGKGDTAVNKTHLWFNGYRLDRNNVKVYWTTKPEVNVKYFVVQRRLSNETNFSNRDSLPSKALNGYSNTYLDYALNDLNSYTGISYYRLILVDYNGVRTYSNTIAVGNKAGGLQLLLWPNPSTGTFYLGINQVAAVKYVVIWNTLGQMIHRELVNERSIIPMHLYLPGAYAVGFISESGQLLETKKLIVTGD
jgi:hypothetical protein